MCAHGLFLIYEGMALRLTEYTKRTLFSIPCMITQLHHRAKYCLNIKCVLCQGWHHQSCLRCRQTLNLLMKSSSYSVGSRHHDNSYQRPVSTPTIIMYWEGRQSAKNPVGPLGLNRHITFI